MDPPPEPPPGCLVILTPLSAGMAEDARVWLAHRYTPDGEPEVRDAPKSAAARFLADELIDGLAGALAAGYPLPLDVAVLGYRTGENGALELTSLLPDGGPARLTPLADLAYREVEPRSRDGDPRKWTAAAECAGAASPAAALAEAYKFVAVWLTGRYAARPPVVIHVTDGEGLDAHYSRVARSLGLLATGYGPARLLHVGLAPGVEPALCGAAADPPPEPWAGLAELSAELPAEPDGRPARRAVSVNDWALADFWSAVFDMAWAGDAVAWAEPDAGRFEPDARGMRAEKMGNTPEQWEDAYAAEPAAGVAAVADGASTGIYCRTWADQLSRRFVSDRPDVRDPAALGRWVHGLRTEWRATIDYDNLGWSKKAKVDDVGAAATLLGLEVGPLGGDGTRPWRACAVGDASLFWVRGGELLGTFPVVAADQFGSAPLLVRSNPGYKTLALGAAGACRPGDRFFLATDAVAARLFRSAAGPGPEWARLETMAEDEWRAELDALRRANDMVNDDCTLVALCVAGPEPRRTATAREPVGLHAAEGTAAPPLQTEPNSPYPLPDGRGSPEPEDALPLAAEVPNPTDSGRTPSVGEGAESHTAEGEPEPEEAAPIAEEVPDPPDETPPDPPDETPPPPLNGTPESPAPNERTTARDGFSNPTEEPV